MYGYINEWQPVAICKFNFLEPIDWLCVGGTDTNIHKHINQSNLTALLHVFHISHI